MSPEEKHEFERVWPELATRLEAFLARKRIPLDQREDLVQETGTRLVGIWDTVDRGRPTWPLAMTVCLNLIRDRARRHSTHEIVSELPDMPEAYDVEAAGLARVELHRVREALPRLTFRQREALLAEIGCATGEETCDKLTRSRARQKLNHLVGRASAGLAWQFRRLADAFHAIVGSEGALQGLGCSACALLAMSAVLVPHTAPAMGSSLGRVAPERELTVVAGAVDLSKLALSGAASRAMAPVESERTRTSLRTRRPLASRNGSHSTQPAGGAESPVPAPSELPDLPGRGGDGDDVPTPRPPAGLKRVLDSIGEVTTPKQVSLKTL